MISVHLEPSSLPAVFVISSAKVSPLPKASRGAGVELACGTSCWTQEALRSSPWTPEVGGGLRWEWEDLPSRAAGSPDALVGAGNEGGLAAYTCLGCRGAGVVSHGH